MKDLSDFKPIFGLKNPHLQTLLAHFISRFKEPQSVTQYVNLPDGDKLALEVTTPKTWKPHLPTVLLMHGIGGSHKSRYLIRMARRLSQLNIQAVRLNFRGIGSGVGLAKKISHGGATEDLDHAIKYIQKKHPSSPLVIIGFSLSGNLLLKHASDQKNLRGVKKIIAVAPPINLKDSAMRLEQKQNRLYQKSILKSIIDIIESPKSNFSFQVKDPLSSCTTLREFDTVYTAPCCGFIDVNDYYDKCSAAKFIAQIEMPCHILFAEDDPLVNCKLFNFNKLPSNFQVVVTKYGGHMGFLGSKEKEGVFWMDSLLLHWIQTD